MHTGGRGEGGRLEKFGHKNAKKYVQGEGDPFYFQTTPRTPSKEFG
jgi:hypothetical protein